MSKLRSNDSRQLWDSPKGECFAETNFGHDMALCHWKVSKMRSNILKKTWDIDWLIYRVSAKIERGKTSNIRNHSQLSPMVSATSGLMVIWYERWVDCEVMKSICYENHQKVSILRNSDNNRLRKMWVKCGTVTIAIMIDLKSGSQCRWRGKLRIDNDKKML